MMAAFGGLSGTLGNWTSTTSDAWSQQICSTTSTTSSVDLWFGQQGVQSWQTFPNTVQISDRVIYDSPPLGFNRFVNASDLLEEFIRYVGALGVKQGDVLQLPIDLFIKWLIIEAAKKDGDAPPEGVVVQLPNIRCLKCGRFIRKDSPIPFCSEEHANVPKRLAA